MSKLRVQVSPLTNVIYAGTLIKNGTLWGANKTDVTSDVIGSILQYVGDNKTIEVISNGVVTHEISVKKIESDEIK